MPLHKGTEVMLVGLQSSPELNFKQDVLRTYLHDRQRWVVELPVAAMSMCARQTCRRSR